MSYAAAVGLAAAFTITTAQAADISGASATFPYPIYAKWADAYKKETGIGLNYQSIGSGGGIKQIKAGTVITSHEGSIAGLAGLQSVPVERRRTSVPAQSPAARKEARHFRSANTEVSVTVQHCAVTIRDQDTKGRRAALTNANTAQYVSAPRGF